jgi:hypothetical protein
MTTAAIGVPAEAEAEADRPVSTLERFFDLLFVFAITQLTAVLTDDPTPRGVLQVLLIAPDCRHARPRGRQLPVVAVLQRGRLPGGAGDVRGAD